MLSTTELPPLRVAVVGLGTVGSGTLRVLARNQAEIRRRAGRTIQVVAVADLDKARAQALCKELGDAGQAIEVVADGISIAQRADIDAVVELVGGTGFAAQLIRDALKHGKHVVTANKALLATQGNELFAAARQAKVMLAFEAAVAGGIPVIKALREGLSANRIEWIAGIINGTCNFILTQMRELGWSFEQALAAAQQAGYAEADPTFDVGGFDAAHKITLLASLAFGMPVRFDAAHVEGITALTPSDIGYAEELGYRVKLIALARRHEEGVELRVHPCLVPENRLIANVNGVMNAVLIKGDAVGATLLYGAGAGSEPTASAVIADLVDVARLQSADPAHRVPSLAFQADQIQDVPVMSIGNIISSYYLRCRVADEPGVLADITRILADAAISIEALIQKQPAAGEQATDVVVLTHTCRESAVLQAMERMSALSSVLSPVSKIRREELA